MSDYDPNFVPKKVCYLVGQKAVLTDKEGKILLLQRSEKAGGGGLWALPGGAIDEGEEQEESIKREIKEETGLEVSGLTPFTTRSYVSDEKDSVIIIGYSGQAASEEVTLNWEHGDYKWLAREEALKLNLTEDAGYFIN